MPPEKLLHKILPPVPQFKMVSQLSIRPARKLPWASRRESHAAPFFVRSLLVIRLGPETRSDFFLAAIWWRTVSIPSAQCAAAWMKHCRNILIVVVLPAPSAPESKNLPLFDIDEILSQP